MFHFKVILAGQHQTKLFVYVFCFLFSVSFLLHSIFFTTFLSMFIFNFVNFSQLLQQIKNYTIFENVILNFRFMNEYGKTMVQLSINNIKSNTICTWNQSKSILQIGWLGVVLGIVKRLKIRQWCGWIR